MMKMGEVYFDEETPASMPTTTLTTSDTWTRVQLGTVITQGPGSANFTPDGSNTYAAFKFIGSTHSMITHCGTTFSFTPGTNNSDYIFGVVVNGTFDGNNEMTAGTVEVGSKVHITSRNAGDYGSTANHYMLNGLTQNDVITLVVKGVGHSNNFDVANVNMFAVY